MIKALQFGEGNFLRAFVDYYFQISKNNGDFDGTVAICQPRSNTKVINALKSQNCRYNVIRRGRYNGEVINSVTEIDCVSDAIDTVGEYGRLVDIFRSDELEIVVSNTTEAGICFNCSDKLDDSPSVSFPAKVTALLYERFKADRGGLVFLPVELIENNGDELKRCILLYAELWELGDAFIQYVNNECDFANTLVDRIVTGYTEYNDDLCAVACEPYGSFIIQCTKRAQNVLPFGNISEIKYVNSISEYRERKVKILNGAHTSSVLLAYNMGYKIVRDMMHDELINNFIRSALSDEIIPTIDLPSDELSAFAMSVLERFDNPFIDHKLLDISLNSVAKFKARCLPSILDYYSKFSKLPKKLCLGLAGLIDFYKKGLGNDSQDVLDFFADDESTVFEVLKNKSFWDMDLTELDGFYDLVNKYYNSICSVGVKETMESVCNE